MLDLTKPYWWVASWYYYCPAIPECCRRTHTHTHTHTHTKVSKRLIPSLGLCLLCPCHVGCPLCQQSAVWEMIIFLRFFHGLLGSNSDNCWFRQNSKEEPYNESCSTISKYVRALIFQYESFKWRCFFSPFIFHLHCASSESRPLPSLTFSWVLEIE